MLLVAYFLIFSTLFIKIVTSSSFIEVKNARLSLNNHEYRYIGTNFWYGANLGSRGPGGNRDRLIRELDHLHELGVNNLRIQAGSEGPDTEPWRIVPSMQPSPGQYNPEILEGLDFLLFEMRKRQMYAVMCLNNFWHWSGGFAQYVAWADGSEAKIPYPGDYNQFEVYSARFYGIKNATDWFDNHIRFLLTRKNQFTHLFYIDDPTIVR